MKYVLLVSHGTMAPAMHETLNAFFLGSRADLLHANMAEGMSPDEFTETVRTTLHDITEEDELIVLADILGGSPLTYASYAINTMGLLERSWFLGGMNLPMVIDIMMKKDNMSTRYLMNHFLNEARETVRPFCLPKLSMECTAECI